MSNVNGELKQYIAKNILPVYQTFDEGHNQEHIQAVISRSLGYYEFLNLKELNIDMVYTIASYHDIGMSVKRDGHPTYSKQILLQDKNLERWFTAEQILIMADAVEDHSTSTGHEPRTIYGKIVSDADKDTDINIGLMRGWNFTLRYLPNCTDEERLDNLHKEIVRRFGDKSIGGEDLVKFYINNDKNKKFMEEMIFYAKNKNALKTKMSELLSGQKKDNK